MILLSKNIEEKALAVYSRSIKDRRINEDICSDIYFLFIKRMNRYKEKHPELAEVSEGFVTRVVQFIIRDLNKKQYKADYKEEVLETICQTMYMGPEHIEENQNESFFAKQLITYITSLKSKSIIKRKQALWFTFLYSAYLSTEQIMGIVKLMGFDFETLETRLLEIKNKAICRKSKNQLKQETTLGTLFHKIIECHKAMGRLSQNQKTSKEQLLHQYKELTKEREIAINQLKANNILPSFEETAEVLGVAKEGFRYGVNAFLKQFIQASKMSHFTINQLAA